MNILHLKYAVEVARAGSLSRASDVLFIAQPNLSKAIKDLESDLGITIFERTAKGMVPTAQGQDFLRNAERILREIRDLENLYIHGAPERQRFAISVPRATYISTAFTRFSKQIAKDEAEIFYMETNPHKTIMNITDEDYRLGIMRTSETHEPLFLDMFAEKRLCHEELVKFRLRLAFSKDSPLAKLDEIRLSDLSGLIEIAHADPFVPNLPFVNVLRDEITPMTKRRIFVFERASSLDLLSGNPETYMWSVSLPQGIEEDKNLMIRECPENTRIYKDILIYRSSYRFTDIDTRFIRELDAEIENTFKPL